MELHEIYFDQSIKKYALQLTNDIEAANDLISIAYELCVKRDIPNKNLKGYFARTMRNQFYKMQSKPTITEPIIYEQTPDVNSVLERMYPYYSNILKLVGEGDKLTNIHKSTRISYDTLSDDFIKAKKEYKILSSNIKIALIVMNQDGVTYHRLNAPFSKIYHEYKIPIEVHINEDDSFVDKLEDVTHVIFNRNISAKLQPEIVISKLKAKGIKVICDVDDYWVLPPKHPAKAWYKKTNYGACVYANIALSNMVWCTTKLLQDKIKKINPNVHVIKNAIWKGDIQFAPEKVTINYDTFFYSGGNTHFHDLLLVGTNFNNETFYLKTPKIPNKIKGIKVEKSDVFNYANDYHNSGISVIPLADNLFNSFKSELKLLEAGHFCKPALVSYVAPYTNLATVKNSIPIKNNDWAKAIKKIKGNLNMQNDLGLKLKEDVETHYNLDKENRKRIQLL